MKKFIFICLLLFACDTSYKMEYQVFNNYDKESLFISFNSYKNETANYVYTNVTFLCVFDAEKGFKMSISVSNTNAIETTVRIVQDEKVMAITVGTNILLEYIVGD